MTFTWFWDQDLSPVGLAQVVTVTATTGSIYPLNNVPLTLVKTWELRYLDPCSDASSTVITRTAQTNPAPDSYTGLDVKFFYNPFKVSNNLCQLTVRCVSVVPANDYLPC